MLTPENGSPRGLNFNVFNLREQSAGCFCETKKDLRKITKPAEKITKDLGKITKHLLSPSSGLFFGTYGQKEAEEALPEQEILGLAMQRYNIFQRKANRQNCVLTFREAALALMELGREGDDGCIAETFVMS